MTTKKKKEKEQPPLGAIDRVSEGWLRGWYAAPDDCSVNQFTLLIDGESQGTFTASDYRADIASLGIRNGLAGFQIPLPLGYLDEKFHQISIANTQGKEILLPINQKLAPPEGVRKVMNSVISVRQNAAPSTDKLVFYVAYTRNQPLYLYHKKTIQSFQQQGYHVVLIVAMDDGDIGSRSDIYFDTADTVIVRSNIGYDFGSWATALAVMQNALSGIKHLLFINDSIVGPFGSLQPMLQAFEQSDTDLWAVCNSFDRCHHVQSFCYGFHPNSINLPYLLAFFLYGKLAEEKQEAINRFELNMIKFFTDHEFVVRHWLDYRQLVNEFVTDIAKGYKACTVNSTSNLRYFHDRLVTINFENFITNVLAHIEKGTPVNPSHYFWREILHSQFPFIKKELLIVNPENNPMLLYDFGQWMVAELDNAALLDDLCSRANSSLYPALLS